MIERFIELGMLIGTVLISLWVGITLFRSVNKHELAVRKLDQEIQRKTAIRLKVG